MLIAFHKPYGVLSQFTDEGTGHRTLAAFGVPPGVYPLGRLDVDSEGLLLLSDEAGLNSRLLHPDHGHERTYHAQVEGIPDDDALERLRNGVMIQGRKTLPCDARLVIPEPQVPERTPPIRFRASIPTTWIELRLHEGKNRQVRRMTAAVGHPTLRLIRVAIGRLMLNTLECGTWRELDIKDKMILFDSDREPGPK